MKNVLKCARIVSLVSALSILAYSASAQQIDIWTGSGPTTTNWSDSGNWSLNAIPGPGTNVTFTGNTLRGDTNAPNTFVDGNYTIAQLQFTNATSGFNVMQITNGATLSLTNGLIHGVVGNLNVDSLIQGAATLSVSGSNILVDASAGSGTSGKTSILDLSGLNNLNVSGVGRILLGVVATAPYNANNQEGMLYLAKTNVINLTATGNHSTNALLVGWNANAAVNSALFLGQSNGIFADTVCVGGFKSTGSLMAFESGLTGPTALFRAKDGASRILYWGIGDVLDTGNAGSGCAGTNDFTGGTVDILVDKMDIGVGTPGTSGAGASGTLTFNAGTVDVNLLTNAWSIGTGPTTVCSGTINLNGGTLKVNSLLLMGLTPGNGVINSTLNITGGSAFINSIKTGTGTNTTTINMSAGASLVLSNTAGSASVPIVAFNITNSTLTLSPAQNVTNIIALNLNAGGAANTINIATAPPIFSYPAQIPLITYTNATGDLTTFTLGSVPLASPTPYQGYISNNATGKSIDLVLTNGPLSSNPPPAPKSITWNGVPNGNWDNSTLNWLSNGVPVAYTNLTTSGFGDSVAFDDTLHGTTNVVLTTALKPGSLTVNNSLSNYVFTGSGRITGAVALIKQGTASLTLAETGADDFSGGITISNNGGTLVLDNAGTNSFNGSTQIGSSSVLVLGNNDTNGFLPSGFITNNGTLALNRGDSSLTIAGPIYGPGSLAMNGTGTVTIVGVQAYTGPTVVNNGTLVVAGPNQGNSGIRTSSSITVNNGGTLAEGSDNGLVGGTGPTPIIVNAGGILTGLASLNGGEGASSHLASPLTLNGGTLTDGGTQLVPGDGTWDIEGGVTVPGSPVTSTISTLDVIPHQSGGTTFNITNGSTPSGVDLDVSGSFISGTSSGFADTGITLNGNGTMALDNTNTYLQPTTINGGTLLLRNTYAVQSSSVAINSDFGLRFGTNIGTFILGGLNGGNALALSDTANQPVTAKIGQNNLNTSYNGIISGNGALMKIGTGMLSLQGTNLYTGNTTISNGTLQLSDPASLDSSPVISMIAPTAVLDPSGRGDDTITIHAGQTLNGNGTINGFLTNNGTLSLGLGSATGTITANNSIGLQGNTIMKIDKANATNDLLSSPGSTITYGGTLTITSLSTPLALNDTFQLFNAGSGYSGVFNAIVPAQPGSGLAWNTNNLATDGTISVMVGPVTGPTTNATITKVSLSGTNMLIHGTNNNVPNTSFHYVVLTTPNLTNALSNWTPVVTNPFNPDGTFDYTNPIVPGTPRQFIDVEAVP